MKIGVELFDIVEGPTGGLTPLVQGVLEALFAGWPEHTYVLFCTPENERLFDSAANDTQILTLPKAIYFPFLDVCGAHFGIDVLLRSYPSPFDLEFPMERQIVIIPDLQHEFFPEFFAPEVLTNRRAGFAQALASAGAIATLSAHARQTLKAHPSSAPGLDIFLMPPALRRVANDPCIADLTEAERALVPHQDFFIYPANLWPHKNHRRVVQAFKRFLDHTRRPCEFIFTGHPEGWEELARDFPALPIRHLGFVRRAFLQVLLSRARALIYFSLFEGFGIPLLEAFAADLPVACSDTTSLPEIGGDAVLLCDPTDPRAISDAMVQIAEDESLRARLTARGKSRLSLFSWSDSAAQLVHACARVHTRASMPSQCPLRVTRRLSRLCQDIEADRAAKLDLIHRLDASLRQTTASLQTVLTESVAKTAVRLTRKLLSPVKRRLREVVGTNGPDATPRDRAA
jgi:glycosyltransferase involved in cell wall biosynthesis